MSPVPPVWLSKCRIFTVRADGTGLTRVTTSGTDNFEPALSPDKRRIAFARGLLSAGEPLGRRLGGRTGRAVTAFARGGLAAVDALERARFDVFSGRPKPSRARLARTAIGALVP